jgi:hypothetical protein
MLVRGTYSDCLVSFISYRMLLTVAPSNCLEPGNTPKDPLRRLVKVDDSGTISVTRDYPFSDCNIIHWGPHMPQHCKLSLSPQTPYSQTCGEESTQLITGSYLHYPEQVSAQDYT